MNAFAAAMDRIYANPSMAAAAVWISATTSEERPIRVIRRAPDRITEFGAARFVSDTLMVDVRVSDLPIGGKRLAIAAQVRVEALF